MPLQTTRQHVPVHFIVFNKQDLGHEGHRRWVS
jgi:hypothetical protein